MTPSRQSLEVWGSLACFTRPELKVERFSYPLITPSAARGIFDAICVNRHKYRWQVTQIEVLSHPAYIALRRNEVKFKAPALRTISPWMAGRSEPQPLMAGAGEEANTQRQTMALKDVHYRIHAEIRPWPGFEGEIVGMEAKFRRRAQSGQCFYQPYLGCREFPAFFRLLAYDEPAAPPVPVNSHIGWMLYDVFDLSCPGTSTDSPFITLFDASVVNGVLLVPEFDSTDVRKPSGEASHA